MASSLGFGRVEPPENTVIQRDPRGDLGAGQSTTLPDVPESTNPLWPHELGVYLGHSAVDGLRETGEHLVLLAQTVDRRQKATVGEPVE